MVPAVTDSLMTADMTAQQSAAYWRTVMTATARTVKTIRPKQLTEVFPAIFVATKPRVEFLKVSRIVFHALAYYGLYAGESSGYPVHSILVACLGSMDAARCAGTTAATNAAQPSNDVLRGKLHCEFLQE
jgi:hypothetical protein